MAQPRAYSQTTTFNDFSTTNPSDPHSGSNLDTEFAELKQNTDDLNTNIALLQRDDGKLNNEAVHKDAFDQDSLALIGLSGYTLKGAWVTATAYVVGDLVTNNDATYVATEDHTSATFSTDIANWILIANSAIETTGASVNTYTGDGTETEFATTYDYSGVTDIQVFVAGSLVTTDLYTVGTNIITFTSPPANTAKVIIWGDAVVSQTAAAATLGYRDTANNHKITAERWSDKDDGSVVDAETTVDSNEYSARAYAVGGVGVTTTSGKGAAKQWATTTGGKVDTDEYSAKEYAQGSVLAAGGSAKNWATLATTPTTTTEDASAREWAIGTSTHKGDASAKEYATSAQYDSVEGSAEYSAKHYSAQAQDWAVKTTIVRNDANGADVDYSAKEWAAGQLAANTSGSAKQWALGGGNFYEATAVEGSNYSAKRYASLTALDVVATNADVVSAAAHLATFQSLYHGALSSPPSSNVSDGDLYFDTNSSVNVIKVYNSTATAWEQLTPSSSEMTAINTVNADAVDIGKVAAVDTEIGRLGTSDMSVGTDAYLKKLGVDALSNASTGYLKLVGDIDDKVTIVGSITVGDVTKVANITTGDVSKVADIVTGDVTKVASITTGDVTKVADIDANVTKVADIDGNVTIVAGIGTNGADVTTVAGKATEIGRLGTLDAVADMNTLGTSAIVADLDILADRDTELGLLGTSDMAHATTGNLKKLGDISTSINTAATNLTGINYFGDQYQVDDFSPSAPTTDGGSNALAAGDLAYDTTATTMKVYNGTGWDVVAPSGSMDSGGGTFTGVVTFNYPSINSGGFSDQSQLNLSGTIDSRFFLSNSCVLTGDVTLDGNVILAKVSNDGVDTTLTTDGTTRTISGTGTLASSVLFTI